MSSLQPSHSPALQESQSTCRREQEATHQRNCPTGATVATLPDEGWVRPRVSPFNRPSSSLYDDDGWGRPRTIPPLNPPTPHRSSPLPANPGDSCVHCFCQLTQENYCQFKLCRKKSCRKKLCNDCRKQVIHGWCENGPPHQCIFCKGRRLTMTRDEMLIMSRSNTVRARDPDRRLYCNICDETKGVEFFNLGVPLCNSTNPACREKNFLCISCRAKHIESTQVLRCPFCRTTDVVFNL